VTVLRIIGNDKNEVAVESNADGWAFNGMSFSDWRRVVDEKLVADYGITIEDSGVDDDYLKTHWEMRQSPYEFVEWFGIKYDLDPVSASHWG
jgi:hypothetical protein